MRDANEHSRQQIFCGIQSFTPHQTLSVAKEKQRLTFSVSIDLVHNSKKALSEIVCTQIFVPIGKQ